MQVTPLGIISQMGVIDIMTANAALNVVPPLRAQSAELAQADSGARKCGIKLRLTVCSGTFVFKFIQVTDFSPTIFCGF